MQVQVHTHKQRHSKDKKDPPKRLDCVVLLGRETNTDKKKGKLKNNEAYLMGFGGGIFGPFLSEHSTCL